MGGNHGHSSFPDTAIPNEGLPGNHVPSTDSDATDSCPPNEDNPWSCMETIQLAQAETPSPLAYSSDPGNANLTPDHTNWIHWIDRHKHLLRECTGKPWFLQLKSDWKQYLRQHMAANEDNVVSGQREFGEVATLHMSKLRLWKQWVAQQHQQMRMYTEQWFQHLLHSVEDDTVPANGEVPVVRKDLEVEQVMGQEDVLRVRDVPRTQPLHQPPHMKQRLTAKIWILILACVIEDCALECRLHDRELYVDDILQQCSH
ncbi:hypothetical protein AK88_01255 [Plasmodium fragile]|uniref:Schizont-infected cell agglutination C-terminal domain-containing protein n=1 Tax=Plasmodium fragile TaxID=5857 RepID=A0A0D9QQ46_PLAFR|nr:uncharacterized protein AK88_01255 [Plasmodium fragile]KJP89169.1 hypothetical protein AK88_01255 [Plasmodium fragile]